MRNPAHEEPSLTPKSLHFSGQLRIMESQPGTQAALSTLDPGVTAPLVSTEIKEYIMASPRRAAGLHSRFEIQVFRVDLKRSLGM